MLTSSSSVAKTFVTLLATALMIGTTHARLGLTSPAVSTNSLDSEGVRFDRIRKSLVVAEFTTDQDLGQISPEQINMVTNALKVGCNHAHPSEEVVMMDARVKMVTRDSIPTTRTKLGLNGEEVEYSIMNYVYYWIYQTNIGCNLCYSSAFASSSGHARGHLNEWESDFDTGLDFNTKDVKITVAYEHEHASSEVVGDDGDKMFDTLAVVQFKTDKDYGEIDISDTLQKSCNSAHPSDEVWMISDTVLDARKKKLKSGSSMETVVVDSDGTLNSSIVLGGGDDVENKYSVMNYVYYWIYQTNIGCNLCYSSRAEDGFIGEGRGHLKEWVDALDEAIDVKHDDVMIITAYEDLDGSFTGLFYDEEVKMDSTIA